MKSNQRNYRATFILDNRGQADTIEQIIEGVKTTIPFQAKVMQSEAFRSGVFDTHFLESFDYR